MVLLSPVADHLAASATNAWLYGGAAVLWVAGVVAFVALKFRHSR